MIYLTIRRCIFYAAIIVTINCIAQKENTKWLFGYTAYLDFSSGTPVSLPNASITAMEGSASIADANGNLLLYTNGQTLWNKNHQVISSSLAGHVSSNQSSLIVKKPGSASIYYVFTTGAGSTGNLSYSVVDISLSSGNGSVTLLNAHLLDSVPEKLCGTLHCNGTDTWIVAHKTNNSDFYAYLLQSSGLASSPVISTAGTPHMIGAGPSFGGAMKISPTGKKLGLAITNLGMVEVFDFNNKTGQVFNPLVLDSGASTMDVYGCEFSPDGTKFYSAAMPGKPYVQRQWDLCAGSPSAVVASSVIIGSDTLAKTFQLGPDGKIYICRFLGAFGGGKLLSTINSPNQSGTACNFQKASTSIIYGIGNMGLPNFITSAMRERNSVSIVSTQTCGISSFSAEPVVVCAAASDPVSAVDWNFGDKPSAPANTSTAMITQHEYTQNGTYTVTLIVHYDCYSDTIKKIIQVTGLPTMSVSGPAQICKGESRTFTVQGAANYSWSAGGTASTTVLSPTSTTVYSVTGVSHSTGCSAATIFTVSVIPCNGLQETEESEILVYPNPAARTLDIKIKYDAQITVYNSSGNLCLSAALQAGENQLDLASLPAGLYYIVAEAQSGKKLFARKLIRE